MTANMIIVGAAYQAGAQRQRAESIEQAIALNGVAVRMNTDAFRLGRRAVADPAWLSSLGETPHPAAQAAPALAPAAQAIIDAVGATGELRRLLAIRVPELIAYQNAAYARQYADFVRKVRVAEQAAMAGETRLSEAVARYLFKLMAYKDEYEVARLHLASPATIRRWRRRSGRWRASATCCIRRCCGRLAGTKNLHLVAGSKAGSARWWR